MKAQSVSRVYRAEDGCRYERQHGSTANLDIVDSSPLLSTVKCHRCGEMGHKASNCKTGQNKKVQVNCPTSAVLRWRSILANILTLQSNAVSVSSSQLKCYECEEFGHSVRSCPNL